MNKWAPEQSFRQPTFQKFTRTQWLSNSHFKCCSLLQVTCWNVGCWNDSSGAPPSPPGPVWKEIPCTLCMRNLLGWLRLGQLQKPKLHRTRFRLRRQIKLCQDNRSCLSIVIGYSLQGGAVGGEWMGVILYSKMVYNTTRITTPCFHCTPLCRMWSYTRLPRARLRLPQARSEKKYAQSTY